MKVLLTSCGLETEEIKDKFISFFNKDAAKIKAVFIPTAAVDADAIEVLPKCLNDLLKCGINRKNVFVYDLHKPMLLKELSDYDVVYICGGNTEYLLERINEQNFCETLNNFIKKDKIVVGVSAGSIIFAKNLKNNLGILHSNLYVHCSDDKCEATGFINLTKKSEIKLGNNQALVFENENCAYIIE